MEEVENFAAQFVDFFLCVEVIYNYYGRLKCQNPVNKLFKCGIN